MNAVPSPNSPTNGNPSGVQLYAIAADGSMEYSDEEPDEWRASDDLLLVNAIVQLRDIELVHKGTKFSYPFSLEQVVSWVI